MQLLAGDIGGTKTTLALSRIEGGKINLLQKKRYTSNSYASAEDLIGQYIKEEGIDPGSTVISLGIAGTVTRGECHTTNLPWTVDESLLKEGFKFRQAKLLNDFKAIAYGIPLLQKEDIALINKGYLDREGPIAIIGAGTGLGEGMAFFSQSSKTYEVIPSEGGHSSFSPTNEEEIGLLKYLIAREGHVSFEKILSGQGLFNIYNYFAESGYAEKTEELTARLSEGEPAALISEFGLSGKDSLSRRSLEMFVRIYGVEAGNLALKFLPSGGLYLAGGIAPKIIKLLQNGLFMESFTGKGRLSGLLKNIPVYAILNEDVGLIGAAARGIMLFSNELENDAPRQ